MAPSEPPPPDSPSRPQVQAEEFDHLKFTELVKEALKTLSALKGPPVELKELKAALDELSAWALEPSAGFFTQDLPGVLKGCCLTLQKAFLCEVTRFALSGGTREVTVQYNGRPRHLKDYYAPFERVQRLGKIVSAELQRIAETIDTRGSLLYVQALCLLAELPQLAPDAGFPMNFEGNLPKSVRSMDEGPEKKEMVRVHATARRILAGEVWRSSQCFMNSLPGVFSHQFRVSGTSSSLRSLSTDMGSSMRHDDADKDQPSLLPTSADGMLVSRVLSAVASVKCTVCDPCTAKAKASTAAKLAVASSGEDGLPIDGSGNKVEIPQSVLERWNSVQADVARRKSSHKDLVTRSGAKGSNMKPGASFTPVVPYFAANHDGKAAGTSTHVSVIVGPDGFEVAGSNRTWLAVSWDTSVECGVMQLFLHLLGNQSRLRQLWERVDAGIPQALSGQFCARILARTLAVVDKPGQGYDANPYLLGLPLAQVLDLPKRLVEAESEEDKEEQDAEEDDKKQRERSVPDDAAGSAAADADDATARTRVGAIAALTATTASYNVVVDDILSCLLHNKEVSEEQWDALSASPPGPSTMSAAGLPLEDVDLLHSERLKLEDLIKQEHVWNPLASVTLNQALGCGWDEDEAAAGNFDSSTFVHRCSDGTEERLGWVACDPGMSEWVFCTVDAGRWRSISVPVSDLKGAVSMSISARGEKLDPEGAAVWRALRLGDGDVDRAGKLDAVWTLGSDGYPRWVSWLRSSLNRHRIRRRRWSQLTKMTKAMRSVMERLYPRKETRPHRLCVVVGDGVAGSKDWNWKGGLSRGRVGVEALRLLPKSPLVALTAVCPEYHSSARDLTGALAGSGTNFVPDVSVNVVLPTEEGSDELLAAPATSTSVDRRVPDALHPVLLEGRWYVLQDADDSPSGFCLRQVKRISAGHFCYFSKHAASDVAVRVLKVEKRRALYGGDGSSKLPSVAPGRPGQPVPGWRRARLHLEFLPTRKLKRVMPLTAEQVSALEDAESVTSAGLKQMDLGPLIGRDVLAAVLIFLIWRATVRHRRVLFGLWTPRPYIQAKTKVFLHDRDFRLRAQRVNAWGKDTKAKKELWAELDGLQLDSGNQVVGPDGVTVLPGHVKRLVERCNELALKLAPKVARLSDSGGVKEVARSHAIWVIDEKDGLPRVSKSKPPAWPELSPELARASGGQVAQARRWQKVRHRHRRKPGAKARRQRKKSGKSNGSKANRNRNNKSEPEPKGHEASEAELNQLEPVSVSAKTDGPATSSMDRAQRALEMQGERQRKRASDTPGSESQAKRQKWVGAASVSTGADGRATRMMARAGALEVLPTQRRPTVDGEDRDLESQAKRQRRVPPASLAASVSTGTDGRATRKMARANRVSSMPQDASEWLALDWSPVAQAPLGNSETHNPFTTPFTTPNKVAPAEPGHMGGGDRRDNAAGKKSRD